MPKAPIPVIELENVPTKELQRLTNLAYRKFYLRFSQIIRIIASIKTLGEFKAYIRGAYGLLRKTAQWEKSSVTYD